MLEVDDLCVAIGAVSPLSGVSFALDKGETLGVVGESGSGKSLTAMTIMGLLPLIGGRVTTGSIMFDGSELADDRNWVTATHHQAGRIYWGPTNSAAMSCPASSLALARRCRSAPPRSGFR